VREKETCAFCSYQSKFSLQWTSTPLLACNAFAWQIKADWVNGPFVKSNVPPGDAATDTALNQTKTLTTTLSGTDFGVIEFDAIIENGANAGTFSLRWAQNASNVTAVNVRPGSYLEYIVS
jgi:hypothetical protein